MNVGMIRCARDTISLMNTTPIIIFDGPDNVGKGTQLSLLRKHYKDIPFAITNLDKPIGANSEEKREYGLAAAYGQLTTLFAGYQAGIPQIADRAHYSEYAYSILRGQHQLTDIMEMESEFKEYKDDVLSIIFIDEVENICERDDGNSNYGEEVVENIKNIITNFKEHAAASLFETHIIDINGKDIEIVQQEVNTLIAKKFPTIG